MGRPESIWSSVSLSSGRRHGGAKCSAHHFGVVLEMATWEALAARLQAANIEFVIAPHIRFKGLAGEQATMFFYDPSGNALEFKAFNDIEAELFKI